MAQGIMGQQNMGVTKKKISLTNGFANALNLPRHKGPEGDYPIYPHGDGSKVALQRSQAWFKAAEITYNSPSNARVVCLSKDGANVLYWASPVKNGKLTTQLEAAGSYMFDKTVKGEQHINTQQYTWENAGLQALVNPVVCSNIEELWVSMDIFACSQYFQYYQQLCGLQPGQVSGAPFLTTILENEISTPNKRRTIAETFPLLRAIVVVMTPPTIQATNFHKCAVRTAEIKAILEAKFPNKRRSIGENADILQQLALQTGFGFAVCPVLTGDILKFSLGDYKYDQKVLSGVRAKLIAKYTPKPVPTAVKPEPIKPVVSKIDTQPPIDDAVSDEATEENLADVIKILEAEYSDIKVVAKALYMYKAAKPDYFKRQVAELPTELKRKYSVVFYDN